MAQTGFEQSLVPAGEPAGLQAGAPSLEGGAIGDHRVDARAKVTGAAVYSGDVQLPGMLHAAVVRSPFPRARIVRIDTDRARAIPGVRAVLTARDIPYGLVGRRVRDMPVLAADEVRFAGERVVAVAADTEAAAREAAAAVEVEYEPLPAVLGPEEALRPGAPRVHQAPWSYPNAVVTEQDPPNVQSRRVHRAGGDVHEALARCRRVLEGTFRTPPAHQGYTEPHACVARVSDGVVEVWASNKSPYALREQLSRCLGVRRENIRVQPAFVGGDFGGKGSPMDIPVCIALAQATGRPVKLVMPYSDELSAANPRHPAVLHVRLGLDEDGRIAALHLQAVLDGGAYAAFKPLPHVHLAAFEEAAMCYRVPALLVESIIVYTNTVPKGHMRAPGATQVTFAVECMMDRAARALELDPVEFRLRNAATGLGGPAPGEGPVELRVAPTLAAAKDLLEARRNRPPAPASQQSRWAHGTGVALYSRRAHAGETEVALQPHPDGTLTVWVAFPDQGGGQMTVAARAVQRELGLAPQWVQVRQASTAQLAVDSGVGGSRVTMTASEAVVQACRLLRQRLAELGLGEVPPGDAMRLAIAELARRRPDEWVRAHVRTGHEDELASVCAQAARVRVDRLTGEVVVDEIITAVDVAEILHPPSHEAQIEGGVMMGYGAALLEELPVEQGRVAAATLADVRLPTLADLPCLTVRLVPGGRGAGPFGVKPIGELTNVAVPAAIANAVADAVGARIDSLPITAEKVYRALQAAKGSGEVE